MKNLIVITLLLCVILLSAIPVLAAEYEIEPQNCFVSEFGLRNTLLYYGISDTVAKTSIISTTVNTKNPWIATGLSIIVPGLGQFYNGHYLKGGIQLGLVLSGYILLFDAIEDNTEYSDGTIVDVDDDDAIGELGLLIAGGTALWSIIDAPISANNINKRNQLQAQSLNNKDYQVSPLVKQNKLGVKFALRF